MIGLDTPTERLVFHSEDEVSARLLQTVCPFRRGYQGSQEASA